jgi:hypothetical protein
MRESIRVRRRQRIAPTGLAPLLALGGLIVFWGGTLVAGAVNPAYSHRRDYISVLAAHGADRAWLGVVAIAAAAVAILACGVLVRPLSRVAAVVMALAGVGFLVVAFARLDCPNGAAGCGLGGRFAVSGSTEITHWTATTVSTVLLITGIAVAGVVLVRNRHTVAGLATLTAAATTAGAFLAMGGQSPGDVQRVGVLVATGWLAAVAIAALAGRVRSR